MGTISRNANTSRSAHTRPVMKKERATKVTQRVTKERGPAVSTEARHRLAECCAFFKAEQHRKATPDAIRKRDIENAESEIARILKNCGED